MIVLVDVNVKILNVLVAVVLVGLVNTPEI